MLNKLNGSNKLTFIACVICVIAIFMGADAMLIMLVIGLLDFLLGFNIYRVKGPTVQAKAMLLTGAYIFVMGVIYFIGFIAAKLFWDIFAGGLLIIVVISFVLFRRK